MNLMDLARKLRPYIEKAAISLNDEDAIEAKELYPNWSGKRVFYEAGTRVRQENILYKVLISHTSQDDWTPANSPSLFAKVLIPDENVVPEWEQPESTNPYQVGDRVSFEGKIWESTVANNVWAPNIYGWVEVPNT